MQMLELMFTHDALKWLLINTNSIDRVNTAGTLLRAERSVCVVFICFIVCNMHEVVKVQMQETNEGIKT